MPTRKSRALDRSPIHLLHRASQCATALFQNQLNGSVLTPRQMVVLMALAENQGISQVDIVERTGIDRSTLGEMVRRLITRGWLERRRNRDDARAYVVKLTDEGWRQVNRAAMLARKVDDDLLRAFSRDQTEQFIARLQNVVAALETGTKA